ncbi:hypothetical protein NKR23_g4937 [Pleurostoma richardsiae]|uniref:Uncharacterized protein n=1 Tax=Pleurostoma richardsiae TaxID=41990 RepID=A0AA38VRH7_9PEZI|nr:hypothetical protein NKR23_g4937 [Pleurostoma richardsiae]
MLLLNVLLASLVYGQSPQAVLEREQYLEATAVVSEPDGIARLECWKFNTPLHQYPTVGSALYLADTTNVTYVVLPPRSGEGLHKPPHPMLFILLSGLAHVTLPHGEDEAWIMEGVNGLVVATDVTGVGHYTEYPSDKETVALQLPFLNRIVPGHEKCDKNQTPSGFHAGNS